jgi:hypothetical protein
MKRVSLLIFSLLFAFTVKAEINDRDHRDMGQLQCRCEASGENLYTRRLEQETVAFDDNDNTHQNRQLGLYVVNGVGVLPSSDTACSSNRDLKESYIHLNEEDKEELKAALEAELEQMDENEGILKPDKMRKLPYSNGYGYEYGYKGSVSWVQSD